MNVQRLAFCFALIAIGVPGLAQDNTPLIIGGVDDADRISSCALAVDSAKLYATPIVSLTSPNTAYVGVTFNFFDATGKALGNVGVTIPPPLPGSTAMQLTKIDVPEGLASTRCSITGRAATAASNRSGAILLGIFAAGAAGALVDIVSNSKANPISTSSPNGSANPTSTPSATSSATASPTPTPTASPSPAPTATPTHTPSPVPTVSPSPSPTPTATPRRR